MTLQVNGATVYLKGKDKTPIAFSDLKVGDRVGVVFAADGFFKAPGFDPSKATFTAKRVHDWQHSWCRRPRATRAPQPERLRRTTLPPKCTGPYSLYRPGGSLAQPCASSIATAYFSISPS